MSLFNVQFERLFGVACWSFDSASQQLHLSRLAAELFGLDGETSLPMPQFLSYIAQDSEQQALLDNLTQPVNHLLPLVQTFELAPVGSGRWLKLEGRYQSEQVSYMGTLHDVSSEKKFELGLIQSERRWRTLTLHTPDIILHTSLDSHILFINYPLPEFSYEQVLALTFYDFLPPEQHAEIKLCIDQVISTGKPGKFHAFLPTPSGEPRYFESHINPLFVDDKVDSLIVCSRDITERRDTQLYMSMLTLALENSVDSVVITDPQGKVVYANNSYLQLAKSEVKDVLGRSLLELPPACSNVQFKQQFEQNLSQAQVFNSLFSYSAQTLQSIHHQQITVTPLRNPAGELIHFLVTGKDVTELVQTKERLRHQALHDSLTSLPNRDLFSERINQAIHTSSLSGESFAVLFIDLDGFKLVNDTLGHDSGDDLLKIIAARLNHSLREQDIVARLGGDEFAVLLNEVGNERDAAVIARQLLNIFNQPVTLGALNLCVTGSIGIAFYPRDGLEARQLLKAADLAMYKAKHLGKNSFQFYANELSTQVCQALQLTGQLRQAIIEQQFQLDFQPQYDIHNQQLVGFEGLLRWHHPELGKLDPELFIHLLEENHLIGVVGQNVLSMACDYLHQWHQAGFPQLSVSVNVSSCQLFESDVFTALLLQLEQLEIAPQKLEIEITESAIIKNSQTVMQVLNELHRHGVRIALDDFGTGYSSLSYLRSFPIDTIKVDRSFISALPENHNTEVLVRAMIALGHALDLQVVAEGVETTAQCHYLQQQGCHLAQGYLFQKPMAADEVLPFLLAERVV